MQDQWLGPCDAVHHDPRETACCRRNLRRSLKYAQGFSGYWYWGHLTTSKLVDRLWFVAQVPHGNDLISAICTWSLTRGTMHEHSKTFAFVLLENLIDWCFAVEWSLSLERTLLCGSEPKRYRGGGSESKPRGDMRSRTTDVCSLDSCSLYSHCQGNI